MTAFSRVQNQCAENLLCWELKSVNHRYLDISFRLPESFRYLEPGLRNLLREQFHRGKIECQLKCQDMDTITPPILVNEGLIKSLVSTTEKLSTQLQIKNDLTINQLLTWPGAISIGQSNLEHLKPEIEQLFIQALEQLQAARKTEGNALESCVKTRLTALQEKIVAARSHILLTMPKTREKWLSRFKILQLEVTEARFEQELALILARLDVNEELDRLDSHVLEVFRAFEDHNAIGRRLDFLMQELNREANTLGSKSDSIHLTQHALEMKVLIEQMREQIQNIE